MNRNLAFVALALILLALPALAAPAPRTTLDSATFDERMGRITLLGGSRWNFADDMTMGARAEWHLSAMCFKRTGYGAPVIANATVNITTRMARSGFYGQYPDHHDGPWSWKITLAYPNTRPICPPGYMQMGRTWPTSIDLSVYNTPPRNVVGDPSFGGIITRTVTP